LAGGLVAPGPDLEIDPAQADEEAELRQTAERFRPRGENPALGTTPTEIPPVYKANEDPVYIAQLRRGRLRRVLGCMLMLLPLIGAVVFAVYQFVPQYAKVEATVNFPGLESRPAEEAARFRNTQNRLLLEEE